MLSTFSCALFKTVWVNFTFWNWVPETLPYFEVSFDYLPQDIFWEQESFRVLQALGTCSAPKHRFSCCCFGKQPQGGSISSTWAFWKDLFLGCKFQRNVRVQNPRAGVSFLLTTYPLFPGQIPALPNRLLRVLSSGGGATPRKKAGGGNRTTRICGDQVTFQNSTRAGDHHPLSAPSMF